MLKTRVIADNVLNLTDARYFAAFGVDYLIFNLSKISKEAVAEICGWVEGVEVLLGIDETLKPELLDFILKVEPSGFVSSSIEILTELSDQLPEKECFLRTKRTDLSSKFHLLLNCLEEQVPSKKNPNQKVFLKTSEVEKALSTELVDGIIVEGEQEEKIGFKNFDELDEIFDQLMIEY